MFVSFQKVGHYLFCKIANGKGVIFGIKFTSRQAQDSMLLELRAFVSSGQQFERKSLRNKKVKVLMLTCLLLIFLLIYLHVTNA